MGHDLIVREQERILQEIWKKNEEERLSNELITKLTLDDGRFLTETGSKRSSQTVSNMKRSKTIPSQSKQSPATRTPTKLTGSRCNSERIAQLKASAENIGSFQTKDKIGGNWNKVETISRKTRGAGLDQQKYV